MLDMGAEEAGEVVAEGAEVAHAVEEAAPALAVADLVAVVVLAVVVVEAVGAAAVAGAGDTVAAMAGAVAAATDTPAVVMVMVMVMVTVTNVMAGGSPKAATNTAVTTAGATIALCAATTDGRGRRLSAVRYLLRGSEFGQDVDGVRGHSFSGTKLPVSGFSGM